MNLFYASTPYHILLCYMLALSECENEHNVLLFGDNIETLSKSQALFEQICPNVFCKVYKLETTNKLHNNLKLLLSKKRSLKAIKKVMNNLSPIEKFYYSCDWKTDVNYISHLVKAQRTKLCYYEDGVNTYTNANITPKSTIERFVEKAIYGSWRVNTPENGHLNKNATIHAIYPNLLSDIYCKDTKCEINPSKFLSYIRADNLPEELKKCVESNIEEFITLPFSAHINEAYITMMQKEIAQGVEKGMIIGVKKHPTADYGNLMEKIDVNNATIELPKEYPVELYYLLLNKSLKRIIGSTSTTMLTAKWLVPNVEALALYTDASISKILYAPKLFEMLEKIGVRVQKIEE